MNSTPNTRIWTPAAADDGSIHGLGNGTLCAYEQGPNIIQVFGPPYSSPVLGRIMLDAGDDVVVRSQREPGTALWTHILHAGGAPLGEMVDFVDAALPCLVRWMTLRAPLRLRLVVDPGGRIVDNRRLLSGGAGGWLCEIAPGTPYYSRYPYPHPVYYQIAWRGAAQPTADPGWVCGPGESWLYVLGGPDYPRVAQHTAAALATPAGALLERTRAVWQTFTRSRRDWAGALPQHTPLREQVLQAVDDVAVLEKTQQSAEGGVLAGHNYHLCYVRDQYGVSRGLLAAGHTAEAQSILAYYWRIWQRHGRIHNAQAAGVDGSFHVHENDEVEITGYLIRQAFDLQASTGDDEIVAGVFPMLEWAFEAQKRHLIQGMLPFNGDETYVAGGILPRTALNDGSAESTLLFVESGQALVDYASRRGRWPGDRCAAERALLAQVEAGYRANFWADGQLAANQPLRAALPGGCPRFRHGVCERCHAEGRFTAIGWTERSAHGRYLCPSCLALDDDQAYPPRQYALQSVSLTPLYFHSRLIHPEELRPVVDGIVQSYRRTGRLPSRPDDARGVAVGYDYGFLLYALSELKHPAAREVAQKTLSLVDPTGAWVEYYVEHQPSGTRYRPWESAINLEALLRWAVSAPTSTSTSAST